MHWTPAAPEAASPALIQTARDPANTLYLPVPGALRVLFRRYESPLGGWAVRDRPGFSRRFRPARLSFSARGILISGADRTKRREFVGGALIALPANAARCKRRWIRT